MTARDADDQQMDGKEFIHMIERLIRWYRRHWGIENGFKKQKHFLGAIEECSKTVAVWSLNVRSQFFQRYR